MVTITPAMKTLLDTQLAVIATASKDGVPNLGPKGSMHLIDDATLAYAESRGEQTLRNILENPRVVVMVINREKSEGYRIYGTAELLTSGDLFERVAARQEQRKKPRPRNVVRIKIENINQV